MKTYVQYLTVVNSTSIYQDKRYVASFSFADGDLTNLTSPRPLAAMHSFSGTSTNLI